MYTRNTSWATTLKSEQQNTMMHSFISNVTTNDIADRQEFSRQLQQIDRQLSRVHAHEYYDPQMVQRDIVHPRPFQSNKLSLPTGHTLTDALLRTTLGCDEKYSKSYVQLLKQTTTQASKQQRIDHIRKRFSQSNTYGDISANSKPFSPYIRSSRPQPVIDNEHQGYLKTQLIFLQKPKNQNINKKEYYDKHYDQITKKIYEMGGMQDTLGKMEGTLSRNQLKSVKKKQILEQFNTSPKRNLFSVPKTPSKASSITGKNWLDRSKQMRLSFKNKFNI